MKEINPFQQEVRKFSDHRLLEIVNDKENYSENLHLACISEASERNISLEEVDLENLLPKLEIEELKKIRRELTIGLTDENIMNYLQVSGLSFTEAANKIQQAKRIKYTHDAPLEEEEVEPNYTKKFIKVFGIIITVIAIIARIIYNLWRNQ